MRHRKDVNNLERSATHRKAMLRNMVMDLFHWTPAEIAKDAPRRGQEAEKSLERQTPHRIRTTSPKAKAARRLAEKLITMGKKGDLAARRRAISVLGGTRKARSTVKKLFEEIAPRYARRQGGYTRIIRLPETIRFAQREVGATYRHPYGTRVGDGASLVLLELVEAEPQRKERRRRARRSKPRRRTGKPAAKEAEKTADGGKKAAAAEAAEAESGEKKAAAETEQKAAAGKKDPGGAKKS